MVPIDMKSSKSIDQLAETLLQKHKCIDVLVNSAGIFPMSGQTPLEGMLTCFCQCTQLSEGMHQYHGFVSELVRKSRTVLFVHTWLGHNKQGMHTSTGHMVCCEQ